MSKADKTPQSRAPQVGRGGARDVWLHRLAGVVLAVLVIFPFHRVLAVRDTGVAGEQFAHLGPWYGVFLWATPLVTVILAVAVVSAVGTERVLLMVRYVAEWVREIPPLRFGVAVSLVGALVTLLCAVVVFHGNPTHLDAASQLLHARYLAAGRLSGPPLSIPEFWVFQYMLNTPAGWVSQYPPGHVAVLAIGLRLGGAWAIVSALAGIAVFLTFMVARELLPGRPGTVRLGAVLLATSPFVVGLAASYMNHITAAALGCAAVYAALRAARGSPRWALGLGAGIGMMVMTRPLSGLVVGAVAGLGAWWMHRERLLLGAVLSRVALAVLAGLPFALALGLYNQRFFGHPLRFGYTAAQGAQHGLGFHTDPWGVTYGPVEALAYVAVELRALSLELLQTPLPALLVLAAFLVWTRRLSRGTWFLLMWAAAPTVANGLYWHHDLVLGPRMLNETAPAWCLLVAIAVVGLFELVSRPPAAQENRGGAAVRRGFRTTVQGVLAVSFGLSLLASWFFMAPGRLLNHGQEAQRAGWTTEIPEVRDSAIVYVHGSWEARLGARLVGLGMRADSVRLALMSNPTCEVQQFLDEVEEGKKPVGAWEELRFGDPPPDLRILQMPSGSIVRALPAEEPPPACSREAASDLAGVMDVTQLLWRGDLPGLPPEGPLFVRDLGPERNLRLLGLFPDRVLKVLLRPGSDRPPLLMDYEEGMGLLWPSLDTEPAGEAPS